MSKALVIKGANFYANKVTTVTLEEIVPCKGIAISDESHAFTAIGATYQLSATVTPIDTTDAVIWNSTNENVVTVSSTGLVTCVGVGTASIIVTCGTKSATCAVTATVTIVGATDTGIAHHYQTGRNGDRDYVSSTASDGYRIYLRTDNVLNGYKAISGNAVGNAFDTLYPIPIPANASNARIIVPILFTTLAIGFVNANTLSTYNISNKGAKLYSYIIALRDDLITYDADNKYYDIDLSEMDSAVNGFTLHVGSGSLTDEETQVLTHARIIFS